MPHGTYWVDGALAATTLAAAFLGAFALEAFTGFLVVLVAIMDGCGLMGADERD